MERRRLGIAPIATALFALGFIAWTMLTFNTTVLEPLDNTSRSPGIELVSPLGQIAAAVAIAFWPGVVYAALAGIAIWAFQRRLRNLTTAICLAIVLGWASELLLKFVFHRARPNSAPPIITSETFSYPSGHMIAITTAALIVIATTTSTRQTRRTIMVWRIIGGLVMVLIGLDRWILHAHYVTDIVAGVFVGGFTASLSLSLARVHMLPAPPTRRSPAVALRHCAVIVNPTKIPDWDAFRRQVAFQCTEQGWQPMWLETTADDPGRGMAQTALRRKVDLVLAAGGDGTIRVVCSQLCGSGVPLGLIPSGTGNLLARNLGIPLDESEALEVAFGGVQDTIDLVEVRVDGAEQPDHFAVMAGLGFDARIMGQTNSDLKKLIGPGAYVMAAAQALSAPMFDATIRLDDSEPIERRAGIVLVGNVGSLQGNLQLLPDAEFDDGLLDLFVASPKNVGDWVRVSTSALLPVPDAEEIDRGQGKRVVVEVAEPVEYQLDGDAAGECRRLEATLVPHSLVVMVPADRRG